MDNQSDTFRSAQKRSNELKENLSSSPEKFRVLTGDRPTGHLHVGHLFGSLLNRVHLQNSGVETFVVIADYQVLTDREHLGAIDDSVKNLVIDYLGITAK